MLDFRVHSVARYDQPQSGTQLLAHAVISFHIAGQTRMSVGDTTLTNPGPYLAILPVGAFVKFDYTDTRDQWAVVLDFPVLQASRQAGAVEILGADGDRIVLPMFTPIVKEHISGWEGEFLRMREAFITPFAAQRLRVYLGVCNTIRYVIDQRRDVYPSAAAKLRWLIDEDRQVRHRLEELSRQCGYSASRLRTVFEREYGMSPLTYRNKARMGIAADLLCNSDLRIKEISDRIGCRHVSHFCALFKSAFALTPSQYQRKVRG